MGTLHNSKITRFYARISGLNRAIGMPVLTSIAYASRFNGNRQTFEHTYTLTTYLQYKSCLFYCTPCRLVVSSTDGTIYVWDVVTRQYVYTENRGTMVKLLAANDQIIATGDSQGTVTISYPNQPQRPARTINAHRGPVAGLIVFNGYILTISTDLKCCLWDSETLQQSHELQLPSWIRLEDPARPGVPTFSVHGNLILLVSDRRFCLWNPRDGKVVHDFKGHLESIRDVKFNSHSVVSSSADGYVKLWNRPTGNFIYDLIWPEHVERRTRHLPGFDTCYRIYVDDRKLVVSGHRQRRTCLLVSTCCRYTIPCHTMLFLIL